MTISVKEQGVGNSWMNKNKKHNKYNEREIEIWFRDESFLRASWIFLTMQTELNDFFVYEFVN